MIVQYLYKNKSVRLQDIGSFTIVPEAAIPMEGDKIEKVYNGLVSWEFAWIVTKKSIKVIAYFISFSLNV